MHIQKVREEDGEVMAEGLACWGGKQGMHKVLGLDLTMQQQFFLALAEWSKISHMLPIILVSV